MDRFRLDDPDAAEKALLVYLAALNKPRGTISRQQQQTAQAAMQAVLDAIEQPRLPTRTEVIEASGAGWVATLMLNKGWATEDPEPEDVPTGRTGEDSLDAERDDRGGGVPVATRLPTRSEVVERLAKVDKLEAAILDIDAHATALGTDEHGFNAIGYAISIGCLHRALGIIGHTAAPCTGDHDHCPKCGVRPFKGLGGWDSVACQICGGTGRPSSTYGRATEDPEPEVDPAQVEVLTKLIATGVFSPRHIAERLLASGRVQVTP